MCVKKFSVKNIVLKSTKNIMLRNFSVKKYKT